MDSNEAREKFRTASNLYKEGRHSEAAGILHELNRAFPSNKRILYPLAQIQAALGNHEEARRIATRLRDDLKDDRAQALLDSIPQPEPVFASPMDFSFSPPEPVQVKPTAKPPARKAKTFAGAKTRFGAEKLAYCAFLTSFLAVAYLFVVYVIPAFVSGASSDASPAQMKFDPVPAIGALSYFILIAFLVRDGRRAGAKKRTIVGLLWASFVICPPFIGWAIYADTLLVDHDGMKNVILLTWRLVCGLMSVFCLLCGILMVFGLNPLALGAFFLTRFWFKRFRQPKVFEWDWEVAKHW